MNFVTSMNSVIKQNSFFFATFNLVKLLKFNSTEKLGEKYWANRPSHATSKEIIITIKHEYYRNKFMKAFKMILKYRQSYQGLWLKKTKGSI